MCIGVLLASTSVRYVCAWCPQRLEEGFRSMRLELQMAVSHHVGAVNLTQVKWKSRQYS